MSVHNRPLDLTILPGDLVKPKPSTVGAVEFAVFARPAGIERWSVDLREETILLVVLGPKPCQSPKPCRRGTADPYFVTVLHERRLLEVILDDLQRLPGVEQ